MLRVHGNEVQLALASHGGMLKRFSHTQVCIVKGDIFAYQSDVDRLEMVLGNDSLLPEAPQVLALLDLSRREVDLVKSQALLEEFEQALLFKKHRNLVDGVHVSHTNDLFVLNLAASSNLSDGVFVEGSFATAGNHVGNQAGTAHRLDGVLSRLGLLLSIDNRHV